MRCSPPPSPFCTYLFPQDQKVYGAGAASRRVRAEHGARQGPGLSWGLQASGSQMFWTRGSALTMPCYWKKQRPWCDPRVPVWDPLALCSSNAKAIRCAKDTCRRSWQVQHAWAIFSGPKENPWPSTWPLGSSWEQGPVALPGLLPHQGKEHLVHCLGPITHGVRLIPGPRGVAKVSSEQRNPVVLSRLHFCSEEPGEGFGPQMRSDVTLWGPNPGRQVQDVWLAYAGDAAGPGSSKPVPAVN